MELSMSMFATPADYWKAVAEAAHAEAERFRIGHRRYEVARRMNASQWADAIKLNTSTGKPFDEIIDNLAPFMGVE